MTTRKSQSKAVLEANSFKQTQRKKTIVSVLLKVLLGLVGISVVAGVFLSVQFLSYYVKPINVFNEFQINEHSTWKGDAQLHIGLWLRQEGSSTFRNGLLVIKPDAGSAHVVLFPEDVSSRNPQQLSYEYAIPIDRYLVAKQNFSLDTQPKESIEELISQFYSDYTDLSGYVYFYQNLRTVPDYVYTDSSPRELLALYQLLRSIPSESFTVVNWSDDAQKKNTIQETILQEQAIRSNAARLWVRNTTDIPGLASKVATMGENLGFDVVRVDNASCSIPDLESVCDGTNTVIVTKDALLLTRAIQRLEEVFSGESRVMEIEDLKRADVVMYVGSDVEEILSQKQKALQE